MSDARQGALVLLPDQDGLPRWPSLVEQDPNGGVVTPVRGVGRAAILGVGTLTFGASAASGTLASAVLPFPARPDPAGTYVVSVANPGAALAAPTVTVGTSGAVGANLVASTTYYYAVTAVTPFGETGVLAAGIASGVEGATPYPVTVAWSPYGWGGLASEVQYRLYRSTADTVASLVLLADALTGLSFVDDGSYAPGTQGAPTTGVQGPGVTVTVTVLNGHTFGDATVAHAQLDQWTVAAGALVDHVVQGAFLGAGSTVLSVALGAAAAGLPSKVLYEVAQP